jgi:3-oxoacyl-[acyl-carrier-protein] synthase-3
MILSSGIEARQELTAKQAYSLRHTQTVVQLAAVSAYLPERVQTSREVEHMIAASSPGFRVRPGIIEARTGIQARRVAAPDEQCSDLAVAAARRALDSAGLHVDEVDLLIFAAASQDLIEPATAHIVQHKLGTNCQVLDVKNACNSFLNGIQVAESLLQTGAAQRALVVSGEVCSRAVRWSVRNADEFREHFPCYTMGDAGAAAVLTASDSGRGLRYRSFAARSHHWPLATIPYGGSMHPRGDEFAYLKGDGPALKDAFVSEGPSILHAMLRDAQLGFEDVDHIFVHQVGVPYHAEMLAATGIPGHKVRGTVSDYGNIASATIPVAHAMAVADGTVQAGDRVMWLGMASGISVALFIIDV